MLVHVIIIRTSMHMETFVVLILKLLSSNSYFQYCIYINIHRLLQFNIRSGVLYKLLYWVWPKFNSWPLMYPGTPSIPTYTVGCDPVREGPSSITCCQSQASFRSCTLFPHEPSTGPGEGHNLLYVWCHFITIRIQ